MHICIRIHMNKYMYIYIFIFIQIYIYIYMHLHALKWPFRSERRETYFKSIGFETKHMFFFRKLLSWGLSLVTISFICNCYPSRSSADAHSRHLNFKAVLAANSTFRGAHPLLWNLIEPLLVFKFPILGCSLSNPTLHKTCSYDSKL